MTDLPVLSLHRAPCGCIGVRTSEFFMFVLSPCDGKEEISFFMRELKELEQAESVPPEESRALIATIQGLLADGYRMRELRALLNGSPS